MLIASDCFGKGQYYQVKLKVLDFYFCMLVIFIFFVTFVFLWTRKIYLISLKSKLTFHYNLKNMLKLGNKPFYFHFYYFTKQNILGRVLKIW